MDLGRPFFDWFVRVRQTRTNHIKSEKNVSEFHCYMWSVSDWRTDEMYVSLDNREQGIYRNLLDECWVSGSITSDLEILARFCREPLDYFVSVWAKIRPKFRPIQNGEKWISIRLEQDRDRMIRIRKNRKISSRKAIKTRWDNVRKMKEIYTETIPRDTQTQTQTHTIQGKSDPVPIHFSNTETSTTPLHLAKNPENDSVPNGTRKVPKYSSEFDNFWQHSTRRGSKVEAWTIWKSFGPLSEQLQIEINDGMNHWKASEQWQDETKQPHVHRWLRRRGWEELVPSANGNGNGSHSIQRKPTREEIDAKKRMMGFKV